ncbi:LPS export ABC transporter periplasmic protein LptC [Lentisphaerota bacterium WC36G]|nr:LPS export ABC transporter periplasmic protein LptC [Lentisphaerae bacterium WC36]
MFNIRKKFAVFTSVLGLFSLIFVNDSQAINLSANKNVSGQASSVVWQIPNKDGRLQYIIFGNKGITQGVELSLDSMLVDFIKPDLVDINLINATQDLKLYKLAVDNNKEIDEFWKFYQHAEAFVHTANTFINTIDKTARSEDEVKFRSRAIDLDGKGFFADYENKTLNIKSNVKIVIRLDKIQEFQKKQTEKKAASNSKKVENEK